ncbi:hypothetical protein [Streptomyces sp. CAU 1734]|uniref:RICIN domain-containing protein n=1 Tax=Streptomyces sp. CAU 1734 TaxID=3140360 RepID=UPI003260F283
MSEPSVHRPAPTRRRLTRLGARLGAVVVALCATIVLAPSPASANPVTIRFQMYAYNECLDSDMWGDAYTHDCGDSNPYQKWIVYSGSRGWQLQSTETGRCLAYTHSWGQAKPHTVECNAAKDEQWWVDYDTTQYVNLVNYSTRKAIQCICNNKGELVMVNPDLGNFAQMFRAINV